MAKDVDFKKGPWRRLWCNFIRGKKINRVSRDAEMWFWRLHAAVDDFGNTEAEPFLLHAATAGRRQMTPDEVVDWVNELAEADLVGLYELNGDDFLHIYDFVGWQPAGRNGKRIRKFPASPWDDGESANDYMHLGGQMVLRSQGESRYVQSNPDASVLDKQLDAEHQDDRGNPVHNYNYNYNQKDKDRSSDDSLVHKIKGLEKGQFVVEVFEYWKQVMHLTDSSQFSPERQRKVGDRWHDSSLAEVKLAIDGCEGDDFYMGRGQYKGKGVHNDIKMICKDRSKIEHLIGKLKNKKPTSDGKKEKQEQSRKRWQSKK